MRTTLLSTFSTWLLASTVLGAPPSHREDSTLADDTRYLIAFGDSYSSNAFNASAAKPSKENPIGNPKLPGITTSGWLNWLGLLTLGYNKGLLLQYDFARGGATVDNSLVQSDNKPDFAAQVKEFVNTIGNKPAFAPWTSENALFAVWFGINDIGLSYTKDGELARIDQVQQSYFKNVDSLYKSGARNFVILTIPPTYRSPMMSARDNVDKLVTAMKHWNGQIATGIENFKKSHDGAKITFINSHVPFNKGLDNPTDYGSSDAKCIDKGGFKCLWHDEYHPGVAIHNLTAGHVASKIETFFNAQYHTIDLPKP